MLNPSDTPIFIICRDKLSCLLEQLDWLYQNNLNRIYLIDNQSTYPPLLDFFLKTHHRVIKLGANVGCGAPWSRNIVQTISPNSFYVVTDPDVVPVSECPNDVISHFYDLLQKYPQYNKTGFSLKIDDIPETYQFHKEVVKWESKFYQTELESGVFEANIDTTFALYRPGSQREVGRKCIRTGFPYQARHLPWYMNSAELTEEEAYYREHSGASHNHGTWGKAELTDSFRAQIDKL